MRQKLARKKGEASEIRAVEFLCENSFEIIDRNFFSRFGEIDIIALRLEVLYFIEVKSSYQLDSIHPIYSITPKKLERILKTTQYYLSKYNISLPYYLGAIVVHPHKIEFIENITIFDPYNPSV